MREIATELTPEQRVVELLRTLNDALVSYGAASTGDGVRLLPSMYSEGSYQELEDRLRDLREMRRPLWWHVSHRYRWGVEKLIVARVIRRLEGPEFVLPPNCELIAGGASLGSKAAVARVYAWSPEVDRKKAGEGVSALVSLMFGGDVERIVLPGDVFRRAMGLPIRDTPAPLPKRVVLDSLLRSAARAGEVRPHSLRSGAA